MCSYDEISSGIILLLYTIAAYCSEKVVAEDVPADMEALVAEKRRELIETVSEVDDKLAEAFLGDETISAADLEVCRTIIFFVVFFFVKYLIH